MAERKPQRVSRARLSNFFRSPLFKILLSIFLFFFIGASAILLFFYNHYSRIIDRRLSGEIFKNTAQIYAAPYRVYPGQRLVLDDVVLRLQRAGFERADKAGSDDDGGYEVKGNRVTIRPKIGDALRLDFAKNSLTRIVKDPGGETDEAWLPAELVTSLSDQTREKRRLVEYKDLPKILVDALISAEDQHFFTHWGVDPVRLIGALLHSLRGSTRVAGTSTITQQLARNFFLTPDRSIRRKITEVFLSFLLEQRLTKQQILTMYANEVYMGQRGSFSVNGFGNGKFSPVKHPDEAKRRRNAVLLAMRTLGAITEKQYEDAKNAELKVAPIKIDVSDAPYLVDFVHEELLRDYTEEEITNSSLRVYTSLDPALQRAAVEAVQNGLKFVETQIAAQKKKQSDDLPGPQAALIALDPHTGEIKAMVGGSDYGASQYNRITQASRQPGSIFKPIVYATAFETAFDRNDAPSNPGDTTSTGEAANPESISANPRQFDSLRHEGVITAITTFMDEPTTFIYDGDRTYEPNNYKQQYRGLVTAREALQHSLNVPTIKIAERVGYDRVALMAKRLGLNAKIKGYPSVALGAFEVTPIEMAGAYTVFANEGRRLEPHALLRVTADRNTVKTYKYEPQEVMRPELVYLMTYLMEGVINSGTGAGVRARGFTLPAAGKTGTSRDGWFAGYTKDLLAIAWVGYDDNRDLNLEGARSALPIWTEFMMKATQLYPSDPDRMYFSKPSGIEFVRIDAESLVLANPSCENTFEEAFIAGTAPNSFCPLHGFRLSEAVQDGVVEAGKGVGKVFSGVGRFFGGLFGGRDDKKPKQ
ncbi:MAG: penicillin-binding protein 1A [Acidobacteria bacterium]|nr:MAG: penicillin-binding protein 1A [Acidobacteriota bacterium]